MFLQEKIENKFCSSETISRVPLSQSRGQVLVTHASEQQNCQQSLLPESKVLILCKNADAHRKQHESLPPEEKVTILETNADAHKKKRESLSPEDKDLFEKNNTAAQHKCCKSLSPDQKAQVYTKNAAEHKNTKSLSLLNKKVKLSQFMRLHSNKTISCFPWRKKQDAWKPRLNNIMII
jgi:hypothetical protein